MMENKVNIIGYCDVGVEVNKKTGKPYSRVLCVNGLVVHLNEYIEPKTVVKIGYDYDLISQRVNYRVESKIAINVEVNDYYELIANTIRDYYNVAI